MCSPYAVGQRRCEFAVRVALGAEPEDLLRLVLRDALELALGGTAVGAVGGMWAGTLLTKVLYDVHPADVTALVSAEAILLGVTLLASLIPALRAMRADPLACVEGDVRFRYPTASCRLEGNRDRQLFALLTFYLSTNTLR